MNAKIDSWSKRYLLALRKHLVKESATSLRSAQRLGHQAEILGLETLDVAQVHKQALTCIAPLDSSSKNRNRRASQAESFFAEAIVPIERTHGAALKANDRVTQLTQTLHKRTLESAASTRHLEESIVRRQTVEAALKKSDKDREKLLQKSNNMHTLLRVKTREILSTQEKERKKTSLQLRDEVAQTLLAINIRLLSLGRLAKTNKIRFAEEIAATQRLVRESIQKVSVVHL